MCNLYTYKLSRDEIRGLLQHYKLIGRQWAEVFEKEMAGKNDEALVYPKYQAPDGAFDETIRGILNLKTHGQQVEIRVVIHRQNYAHLPALAEFIARNLTFVDHVALMGLEMTGFAKANIDALWIDPFDYQRDLYEAASILDDSGLRNIHLQSPTLHARPAHMAACNQVDQRLEERVCSGCAVQEQCGGFFATGRLRQSQHIHPLKKH